MLAGGLLGRVFCPRDTIGWSGLDETQAFTSVLLPQWLWYTQAGPRIPFAAVPQNHRKEGWNEASLMRPYYRRMAMGQSWSVFILMLIHFTIIRRLLKIDKPLQTFKLLNLREVRMFDGDFSSLKGVIYVHVDDVGAGHDSPGLADYAVTRIADELTRAGFPVELFLQGALR